MFRVIFILSLLFGPALASAQDRLSCEVAPGEMPYENLLVTIDETGSLITASSSYSVDYLVEKPLVFEVSKAQSGSKTKYQGKGFLMVLDNSIRSRNGAFIKASVQAVDRNSKIHKLDLWCR